MPLRESVSREAAVLAERTRRQIEAMQDVSLVRMRRLYRDAAKKIAQKVAAHWGDVSYLKRIYDDLAKDLLRLGGKIQDEIEREMARAVNAGLVSSNGQGQLVVPYLRGNQSPIITGASLTRAREAAIRTLQTSVSGIRLSERIWKFHEATLTAMRQVVSEGMLARDFRGTVVQRLKRFLIISDSDMRKKEWIEFFKRHPPGRGVYRSAYKNAERLLRTETMRAYRVSTAEYAKRRAWVHGVRWRLSAAHSRPDICEEFANADYYGLGPGVYPPDATPDSAHPHCMCYLELVPREELTGEMAAA